MIKFYNLLKLFLIKKMIMSHIHNLSWRLVAQFISWNFCKYTFEETDTRQSEHDVLTYLRNMMIERTEKAASQVSEHEIIAKFIMEAKTIRNLSRMSCLENLAGSIKNICPDLTNALDLLLAHLEHFLEALENNENSQNIEILETRISMSVNEFSVEAYKLLPEPLLLKILEDWQNSRCKGRYPKNPDLYKKVLTCLQEEVKSYELTVIANALYDDEAFKRVLCCGVDSQDFSILSSQPLEHSCQDSLHLSQPSSLPPQVKAQYLNNSLSFEPSQSSKLPDSQESVVPRYIPAEPMSPLRVAEHIAQLEPLTQAEAFLYENPNPTSLLTERPSNDPVSKSAFKQSYRTNSFSPLVIHVQASEDIDLYDRDSDSCFPTQKPVSLKFAKKRKRVAKQIQSSDSEDTSDCDKDPDIRFLTPTLFKKGQEYCSPKVVYLSDQESCGSSIVTTIIDSQQIDPSFKPKRQLILDEPIKNPKKVQKKSKGKPNIQKNQKPTRQTTLIDFATKSTKNLPINLNDSHADFEKNIGKKKKVKLFNQDAVPSTSSGANNSSFIIKRKPSKEIQSLGNKRSCKPCNMTFRNPNELKKHIFIYHTYDDLSD